MYLHGTTWSNGLKNTKAETELIKDVDLFQMFENGIRGGLSAVFGDRYIESDNNHKILYIDQKILYGYAMSQHLPTGIFQTYASNSITEPFIDKPLYTHDCGNIGYVITVDIIVPDNIKDKGINVPFCPENITINQDNITEYMNEHVPKPLKPTSKLICDQTNKEYYIFHCRNLNFYKADGYDY